MEIFPYYLEKIKDFDLLHNIHLNSSGALFSTTKIPSFLSSKPPSIFHSFHKTPQKSSILHKIREKDLNFLSIIDTFLSNFSMIDSQYLKIYRKFLSSIFRNGSYQNCIKELIHMYNELVEEFNGFLHEYDLLIRIKTYQDLELFPDEYLNYFEKKLDIYLKNIKDVKLQRNSKYLKLVKKNDFHKKKTIFAEENKEYNVNFLKKKNISLEEILEDFDRIYAGDDQLNESMIENIIAEKISNENLEFKKLFFQNVDMNYQEILKQEFKEIEILFKNYDKNQDNLNENCDIYRKIEENSDFFRKNSESSDLMIRNGEMRKNAENPNFSLENSEENSRIFPEKNNSKINKNLFNDYFNESKKLDFPLQMTIRPEKMLIKSKSKSSYSKNDQNSGFLNDKNPNFYDNSDLTYSKSFYKGDFPLKFAEKSKENESFHDISFQNSLNKSSNSKENFEFETKETNNYKKETNNYKEEPKMRRKRSERLKIKENFC